MGTDSMASQLWAFVMFRQLLLFSSIRSSATLVFLGVLLTSKGGGVCQATGRCLVNVYAGAVTWEAKEALSECLKSK